jgi:WD repeat-containing protein 35
MVYIDDLIKNPDGNFAAEECIIIYETKTLRETKDLINQGNLKKAYDEVRRSPHIKLWKYLAEKALDALDFQMAENAFVEYQDYPSL